VNVYLDTSALLKLLVEEPGSDVAAALWDAGDSIVTSKLAYPEARAALAAAARGRRLTPAAHRAAKSELDELMQQMALIEVTAGICDGAGDLAERFALRGYDAVHLASAVAIADGDTVLTTWAEELRAAAERAGMAVAPSP